MEQRRSRDAVKSTEVPSLPRGDLIGAEAHVVPSDALSLVDGFFVLVRLSEMQSPAGTPLCCAVLCWMLLPLGGERWQPQGSALQRWRSWGKRLLLAREMRPLAWCVTQQKNMWSKEISRSSVPREGMEGMQQGLEDHLRLQGPAWSQKASPEEALFSGTCPGHGAPSHGDLPGFSNGHVGHWVEVILGTEPWQGRAAVFVLATDSSEFCTLSAWLLAIFTGFLKTLSLVGEVPCGCFSHGEMACGALPGRAARY